MKITNLYYRSPIFIQHLLISISGFLRNRNRYGKTYKKHLQFMESFSKLSYEDQKTYQLAEVKKMILHAQKSPYFKEKYKDINIEDIKSFDDIKKIPPITKDELRQNIDQIVIGNKNKLNKSYTGGTTGKSLNVYFTTEDLEKRMATLDFFKKQFGFINLKMRKATFNGKHICSLDQKKPVFWRYNIFSKQMIYSSFHMREENLKFYVKSLNKFKPKSIDGFFSSILEVSKYIIKNNIKLTFVPLAIFPTSETVTNEGKNIIEQAFGCKLYNQYASSEGAPFVYDNPDQELYMDLSTGYIENVNESNEVLVTSFTTHATPLIRYQIGDAMELDENTNKVYSILGRKSDFLFSTNGDKINIANISNIFKEMPNSIINAQLIQNDLFNLEVLLEVDKHYVKEDGEKFLTNEIKHKFGLKMQIEFKYVEHIAREKSGKYSIIKNNVKEIN